MADAPNNTGRLKPLRSVVMSRPSLFLPLFLIIFGAIWFLRATDILPATSTMIAGVLIILGFAVLIMDGINKQSIVSGPMLVYIGTAIYLHMSYWIYLSPLLAIGMVVLGCLLLLSRSDMIPEKHTK
jgi:putative transmembrane protein